MARSSLISAEKALQQSLGDYNSQIDRLNTLIEVAIRIHGRKIIIPRDMWCGRSLVNHEVEKTIREQGFYLEYIDMNRLEMSW